MQMKRKFRILLVEDDQVDQLAFKRFVERENLPYNYVVAGSVSEARDALTATQFDAALIDYLLGDGTAFDLFDEVKNAPIIVITGSGDEEIAVQAMKAGAYDYMVKDLEGNYLKTLPVTVGNAISRKRAEEELRRYQEHLEELVEERTAELTRANEQLVVEIAERKRAEKELKKYSERLKETVEERTQELRESQERLIRQEKLAVLGQLAGGVAHELRNPLGAIKNAAYFLNMVLEEPEPEVKETLRILEKEVATSEKIISSLLDFTHAKPPIRQQVDINHVVQEALSRITAPENVEVVSQLDEALPTILVDPDQLIQVFGNIILNGFQAMPEGGQLVISTTAVTGKPPESGSVVISFSDTGVGIPEENLGRLFEPLFTTKAKGIGLGLAISKVLVEGHGGSIEVQSDVGKSSTFKVRLPTDGGPALSRAERVDGPSPICGNGEND